MKLYVISPLILQKLIWVPTRLLLCAFGNLEIRGLEHLKGVPSNAIFAMNHSSEIDPFIVPASLPFFSRFSPIFYATRERSFYDRSGWRKYMFGGLFINSWGGYTALAGLQDYSKSLVAHAKIVHDGYSFCIFPEGGITLDGTIQAGKGGIAYLAEASACPIVPVCVTGAFRTSAVDFFLGKKKLRVVFGAPISQEELRSKVVRPALPGDNAYKAEAQYVMGKVGELMAGKLEQSDSQLVEAPL